jgi:hypothetical protein
MVDDFRPDYADCFVVATPAEFAAREWAAASLRGADGTFSRVVWQGLLGLDLAPIGTEDTLVGWPIRHDTATRLEVDTDGRLMAGRMTFLVEGDRVAWATMFRFHGGAGRRIWAVAGHVHRALAPRCLESAARNLAWPAVSTKSGWPRLPSPP